MSLLIRSGRVVGSSILMLAAFSVPVFARQEHRSESRPPAQHESRPSHPAGQSHQAAPSHASHASHPSGPSHASGPSHPSGPNNAAHASHPSGAGHPSGPSHPTNASRPSGASRPFNPPTHNAGNRGGVSPGGHPGSNPGHPANAGFNRGGNTAGNHAGNIPENRVRTTNHAERTVSLKGGGSASFRSNGQISSINRNGMQIHNNIHGGRTIVSVHNNVRVVNVGHSGGYVQRSYVTRGGHSYYSRTYYEHGVYRTAVYRGYYYHGFQYYGYHPGFWFHPGFYGWGLHPWGVGISWGIGFGGWGWVGAPWWSFYGGYFAPYPVYPAPAYWLTDYLIAADLQAAYAARAEARAEANAEADAVANDASAAAYGSGAASNSSADSSSTPANAGPVTLSPEVKEAIAEEVKAQLAEQQQQAAAQTAGNAQAQAPAAASGEASATPTSAPQQEEVPPALNPAQRTFIVDNDITVVSDGQECELTGGDVITRLTDTPDADNKVTVSIASSKKTDCAAGKSVLVSVDDLQEMRNHFEEQLDNGMKELAQKQGTGDMPKAPDTGMTESDIPAPAPDTTAAKQLSDQAAAADQTVAEVKQEAPASETPTPGTSSPTTATPETTTPGTTTPDSPAPGPTTPETAAPPAAQEAKPNNE